MKTTITKSLFWMLLLMLLMGGFSTSVYASGGPMPTPPYPHIQVFVGAAFFDGPGPMPTPQYPPFSVSSR